MCWPFVQGPRLEGGIEVLERRPKYPGEPRRTRLNFVKSHSRGDSDEWELIRPGSSRGSFRGAYRHEMTQHQRPWQQPQHFPPLQQQHPPPLQYPQPHPPLGFHGPGHQQQFIEPRHPQYHDVAPGVQALGYRDDEPHLEQFARPRGGDLSPYIVEREPRAHMPAHYQVNLGKASPRSHSRGRQPRRAPSVTTYSTEDTYTENCSYGGNRQKSRRARSRYRDDGDTVIEYERPLRHYARKRSKSRKGYYV